MREFELYCQGYDDQIKRASQLLAWTQANLINIHVPKGKSKVKPEQLLPKPKRTDEDGESEIDEDEVKAFEDAVSKRDSDITDPKERAKAAVADAKARARAAQDQSDSDTYWRTKAGRDLSDWLNSGR